MYQYTNVLMYQYIYIYIYINIINNNNTYISQLAPGCVQELTAL